MQARDSDRSPQGNARHHRSLDRAIEGVDNDFWDVGTELKALLGESWTISLGFRTTMGYVNYKSYGVYLGTTWQF
jgi:hypothetical protein